MPGSPRKRARREALNRDRPSRGTRTYGIPAAEDAAAHAAADALQRCGGDVLFALEQLGYRVRTKPKDEIRRLAAQVFDAEVHRLLNERLANLQEQKTELLARQVQIAKWGQDADAVRAFASLAKVAGWNAPLKVNAETRSVNIHHIMSNPELLAEALGHFSHEPGEAKALTGARADFAVETVDDDEDAGNDGPA